jgi:RNA polymerase sigma-70 factor (ECF subfamily)
MSFEQRLTLGREGNPAALENLFARWRPLLRLQARKLLGADVSARVDPSDVVQEAFAQAFQTLNQFRGQSEGEWVAWLRRIVAGQAAKARRHHHADKRDAHCDQALPDFGGIDDGAGPISRLLNQEQAARLAAAIEALPEPMREVILRRVFHQEPFDVVARAMQRTPGAARVLWTRALRTLREMLDKNG